MRNDAVIPNCDQFAHKGMGLDFAPITDHDVFLNFNERAYKTIISDPATVHINGLDDGDVLTEFHITDLNIF
jgi:hypothetical protein